MPKISTLPPDSAPTGDDYTVTVDTGTNQTKKVKISDLVLAIVNQMTTTAITKRTTVMNEIAGANPTQTISTTFTDVTYWSSNFTTSGGEIIIHAHFSYWKQTSGPSSVFRFVIDGSTYSPSSSGWTNYTNEFGSHKMLSRSFVVSGLSSGTHTIKLQAKSGDSGTTNFDNNDYINLVIVEYLH